MKAESVNPNPKMSKNGGRRRATVAVGARSPGISRRCGTPPSGATYGGTLDEPGRGSRGSASEPCGKDEAAQGLKGVVLNSLDLSLRRPRGKKENSSDGPNTRARHVAVGRCLHRAAESRASGSGRGNVQSTKLGKLTTSWRRRNRESL